MQVQWKSIIFWLPQANLPAGSQCCVPAIKVKLQVCAATLWLIRAALLTKCGEFIGIKTLQHMWQMMSNVLLILDNTFQQIYHNVFSKDIKMAGPMTWEAGVWL